jgi:hypothetical protein
VEWFCSRRKAEIACSIWIVIKPDSSATPWPMLEDFTMDAWLQNVLVPGYLAAWPEFKWLHLSNDTDQLVLKWALSAETIGEGDANGPRRGTRGRCRACELQTSQKKLDACQ